MRPTIFLFSTFFLYILITYSNAEDILGCGGFLKNHADIDFSKVQIKL